jgi:hypothetical protein
MKNVTSFNSADNLPIFIHRRMTNMKNIVFGTITAAAAAVITLGLVSMLGATRSEASATTATLQTVTKWEYKMIDSKGMKGTAEENLTTAGKEGWELVCMETSQNMGMIRYYWFMKRPVQ